MPEFLKHISIGCFILIILNAFVLVVCSTARAGQILIVSSAPIRPYQEAIVGFNRELMAITSYRGTKSIQPSSRTVIDLSEYDNLDEFSLKYQGLQVDLVLAVGNRALKVALNLNVPVVYVMVASPHTIIKGKDNITGVMLPVAPVRQLSAIRTYMPAVKRIGMILSKNQISPLVKKIKDLSSAFGLTVISKRADSPRSVGKVLNSLKGKVDILWLSPSSVLTPTSLDVFTLFSLSNHVPLVAFAPKYLQHGVVMSIFATPDAMGAQAAVLAGRILSGTNIRRIKPEYANDLRVVINPKVASKLRIRLTRPADNLFN